MKCRIGLGSYLLGIASDRAMGTQKIHMLTQIPQDTSEARMRGCYFHVPSGLGIFGSMPLLQQVSDKEKGPELGLRYSSPDITAGAIVLPFQDTQTAWLVNFPWTWGDQWHILLPPGGVLKSLKLTPAKRPKAAVASNAEPNLPSGLPCMVIYSKTHLWNSSY